MSDSSTLTPVKILFQIDDSLRIWHDRDVGTRTTMDSTLHLMDQGSLKEVLCSSEGLINTVDGISVSELLVESQRIVSEHLS